MVIRGGENIYRREVEEFAATTPEVSHAYVIGVPSARYGEEVMAWVKLVDRFPMTITGKLQKFVMRQSAAAELADV
jgi:fatty-acyl-CoA synthase